MSIIQFKDLGLTEYKSVWDYQEQMFSIKQKMKLLGQLPDNHVLLCEHPHVYTLGKSGKQNNLLINDDFLKSIQATYFKINRGGDITYHGPGQIVGYPIIDLEQFNLGVRDYINKLQQLIINVLAEFGIVGNHNSDATGVWLDIGTPNERKICAIGVKVSRSITMHGFALNVNTDLSYFNHINPCGFVDKGVTSMQKELGKSVDIDVIKSKIRKEFSIFQ